MLSSKITSVKDFTNTLIQEERVDLSNKPPWFFHTNQIKLSKCTNLNIRSNRLKDIPFTLPKSLEKIYCEENQLLDMKKFSRLRKLKKLVIDNVISLEGIENLTTLEKLITTYGHIGS
jgi:Leucine-rich repeat (LRR) protein